MWKPGMSPFSPFVATGFLLSSCPWDKISFIFYQSVSADSNSLAFATISLLSSDFTYWCAILTPLLKVALSFSPETIHSNHLHLAVCRIPLSAIHSCSKMPGLLKIVSNPTLPLLQFLPFMLQSCFCIQFSAPSPALTALHLWPATPLPLPCVLWVWELAISIALSNLL